MQYNKSKVVQGGILVVHGHTDSSHLAHEKASNFPFIVHTSKEEAMIYRATSGMHLSTKTAAKHVQLCKVDSINPLAH